MATSELSHLSTCEISDALVKLGVCHGGHLPDIRAISLPSSDARICGPAFTVKIIPESDEESPRLSFDYIDAAPAGCVVVIAAPPSAKNAVWGGLMTAGAQARLVHGVVISGRCRDVPQLRAKKFPVFARATSTLGQSSFTSPSQVNIPLLITPQADAAAAEDEETFPSVEVHPGDWIVADESGVICVPRELESTVVGVAEEERRIDELRMLDIKAGQSLRKVLETHRAKKIIRGIFP